MNPVDTPSETAPLTAAEVTELRSKFYNATLLQRIDVTDDLARFRIRPDAGIRPFFPGQYVAVGMGYWEPRIQPSQAEDLEPDKYRKIVRRAYSISCPMVDESGRLTPCSEVDYLEFYVVLVRQAEKPPALTPRLFLLREGERLIVEKKITGHYTMRGIGPDDTVCFFGTGTGEAPHNAMATQLLAEGHRGRVLVATCVRKREDLGYARQHAALEARFPNYRYLTYTTREPFNLDAMAPGYVGKQYLQHELSSGRLEQAAGLKIDPANTHVFLCGNPEMIGFETPGSRPLSSPGLIQILERRGFHSEGEPGVGLIRFEKYW